MKIRNVVLSMLLCSVAFGAVKKLHPGTLPLALKKAGSRASSGRIAVVSILDVFERCNKCKQWQRTMEAEQKKRVDELDKIEREAKDLMEEMDTRKPGSTDYGNLLRRTMEKEAMYAAKEKFYLQDLAFKESQGTERLYLEIVAAIESVAKRQGIDLVLAKEDNQFPASNLSKLLTTIRMNKVLYHSEEMDITDSVVAAMDKSN